MRLKNGFTAQNNFCTIRRPLSEDIRYVYTYILLVARIQAEWNLRQKVVTIFVPWQSLVRGLKSRSEILVASCSCKLTLTVNSQSEKLMHVEFYDWLVVIISSKLFIKCLGSVLPHVIFCFKTFCIQFLRMRLRCVSKKKNKGTFSMELRYGVTW